MAAVVVEKKSQESGHEKTGGEFSSYVDALPLEQPCKYSSEIMGVVTICNGSHFSCKYKRKETYHSQGQKKHECDRPRIMKLRKILGVK